MNLKKAPLWANYNMPGPQDRERREIDWENKPTCWLQQMVFFILNMLIKATVIYLRCFKI